MGRFNSNVIHNQGKAFKKASQNHQLHKPDIEANDLAFKNRKQNEDKIQHDMDLKERFEEKAKIKAMNKEQEKVEHAPVPEKKVI